MSLTTSAITGRIPLPTNVAPQRVEITFTLTGFDTQGENVVPGGAQAKFVAEPDGTLPAGATLWRNTQGLRGTVYHVGVTWQEGSRRDYGEKYADLGYVQVGDNPNYTLPELLANPAQPQPGWYETVPAEVWQDILALAGQVDAINQVLVIGDGDSEILASITDESGAASFMTALRDKGQPTPEAASLIEESQRDAGFIIPRSVGGDDSGILFAVADEDENISPDLILRREDGCFTDDALRSFGPRLLALNGGGSGGARPARDGTWDHPGGGRFAYYDANMTEIVGWGSSSINLAAPHLEAMAGRLNAGYIDKTKGGQTNSMISTQVGANKPLCLPRGIRDVLAAGAGSSVAVQATGMLHITSLRDTAGILTQGATVVQGVLSYSAADTSIIFTRDAAGPVIDVRTDTTVFVSDEEILRDRVAVVWCGKNDINVGQTSEQAMASHMLFTDYLSPFTPRFVTLGHFQNRDWIEGEQNDLRIRALEELLAETYGRYFIPVLPDLVSGEIMDALSISPTPEDTARMAAGMTPPSLMRDVGHLLDGAYEWIVENRLQPKLTGLGWYKETV